MSGEDSLFDLPQTGRNHEYHLSAYVQSPVALVLPHVQLLRIFQTQQQLRLTLQASDLNLSTFPNKSLKTMCGSNCRTT
ncbi:hypothetical protein scyTo_0014650 [Scyliorhinus torazame]|uniref:Uncharacterized protein n=1 Tax=Scyliorhinus torazame TaxID=75743 RepID=A0A401NRW4_SCYTO|nr:hypothetical protein [Scyliorhinus torazame]